MIETGPASHDPEFVFKQLYTLSDAEHAAFNEGIRKIPTASGRENLFRFNLTPVGIRQLLSDGQPALFNDFEEASSLRGSVVRNGSETFTLFWPGGAAFHDQVYVALKQIFPTITISDGDKYKLPAEHGSPTVSTFDPRRIEEFCRMISSDSGEIT